MKPILIAAAAALALAGPALAQLPIKPSTPSILFWRGDDQATGYRTIEQIYQTRTIKRGTKVHPLPVAAQQIDPTFQYAGKTWTVDDYMKAYRVSGLLVLKDGKIVIERYGLGRGPHDRWTSFSVAKSLTSTLVGAAIEDGKIKSLNAPVTDYIPELKGSAYEGVTVRQMLRMSSGVKWNEDYADPKSDVAQAGFSSSEPGVDPMVDYLRKLPRANPPGAKFNYNTGETDLVGILLANAVGMPIADYASEKIWKPYGMEQDAVWMTDLAGKERGGCCISMTLRDYARVGQFILDGGKAAGKPVVPATWVRDATKVEIDNGSPAPAGYGYFWWISSPDRYNAVGIFGQSITTYRKDRLIIVQNAAWPTAVGRELSAAREAMLEGVRAAVR
ncbi:MAG: class C beta-lactamase-related serine hydrolase [Phenylobacterium sp.]|nr:MAG: class C beta-lactamase-related serine hydrolase [Phenylobacterium sp.]